MSELPLGRPSTHVDGSGMKGRFPYWPGRPGWHWKLGVSMQLCSCEDNKLAKSFVLELSPDTVWKLLKLLI
jgi:hypothetical protein